MHFTVIIPDTADLIKRNPYLLCGYPAYQDFQVADTIARDMSMDYDASERVVAGILYVMRHNLNNGHTCLPFDKLSKATAGFLKVEEGTVRQQMNELLEREELFFETYDERSYVYLPEYWRAERDVAQHLLELVRQPNRADDCEREIEEMERAQGIAYAPLQKKAIAAAVSRKVLVLTGGFPARERPQR